MNSRKLVAAGAASVLMVCVVIAVANRVFAADSRTPAERQQIVVYLNGQQSLPMSGDSIPGYAGGTAALPCLLQNGWKLTAIHLCHNSPATGYAVVEKN